MITDDRHYSSVSYKDVIAVGARLNQARKERRYESILDHIEHVPMRKMAQERVSADPLLLESRSTKEHSIYNHLKETQPLPRSTMDTLGSSLLYRRYVLADPPASGDGILVLPTVTSAVDSSAPEYSRASCALSPPMNSIVDNRATCKDLMTVTHATSHRLRTSNQVSSVPSGLDTAKTSALSRPHQPRVYSIPTSRSPPQRLSSPSCMQDSARSMMATVIAMQQQNADKKRPSSSDLACRGRPASAGRTFGSPSAIPSPRRRDSGSSQQRAQQSPRKSPQKIGQYIPPPVKSPLAQPQALLPFNPRRTSSQYRAEIMALGPPPQVKPMVMAESRTHSYGSPSAYDLKTAGAAHLLSFDRLEF